MWRALQSPERSTEENHGNGKCLGRYWSVAFATAGLGWFVVPGAPGDLYGAPQYRTPALWAGPVGSRLPRSCAYPFQLTRAASNCLNIVGTRTGYTQPFCPNAAFGPFAGV